MTKYPESSFQQLSCSLLESEQLYEIANSAFVDPYLSGKDGAYIDWPFRMLTPREVSQHYTESCVQLIIDSDISDPSVSNLDVLEAAVEYDATAIVLADVLDDLDASIDSIVAGVDEYESHAFSGNLIVPLQPPHHECYQRLLDYGVSSNHTFAIGGLKNETAETKIKHTKQLRDVCGPDVHLHGLGFGSTTHLIAELARDPALLDSIDYSTPIQNKIGETAAGDCRLAEAAAKARAQLIEDMRALSPLTESQPDTSVTTLSDF